jgi:hypothetical protein
MGNAVRVLAALGVSALLLAPACPLQTVQIAAPRNGSLHDDPGLAFEVRTGRNFVHTSTVIRVGSVDLIAALGLVPPFAGAGGNVTVGTDLVAVSDFTYSIPAPPAPIRVSGTLTGLSAGDYVLEAEATKPSTATTTKAAAFAVVEDFTREAEVIASAGTPVPGPVTLGASARIATLGEPLAAPPVGLSGGGELRPGYVPAATARSSDD